MCGVVGIYQNTRRDAVYSVLGGLKRLEYRGYDSAGVAVIGNDTFICEKAAGKINVLEEQIATKDMEGRICIGHTRWATHGTASLKNAHPIVTDHVAIVHNGIIENHNELARLYNIRQDTDTDTEVIARMLDAEYTKHKDAKSAVFEVIKQLKGAFALLIIFKDQKDLLVGVKYNSPLVFGTTDCGYCISSDAMAFPENCGEVIYLQDNDVVFMDSDKYKIYNDQLEVARDKKKSALSSMIFDKGEYKHFMLKEMYEQPAVIANTISTYMEGQGIREIDISKYENIVILGCGSSMYAGMVARYWMEEYARVHTDVEVASEFTYRKPVIRPNSLVIAISQSGETADVINAVKYAKEANAHVTAIVNVMNSTIARMADSVILTTAGPEIGVASTKAFTAQLTLLSIIVAEAIQDVNVKMSVMESIKKLPSAIKRIFDVQETIKKVADEFLAHTGNAIFLGRGSLYPIALEGALKLKEISYIHAEGYTSGELKHGPIALIDEKTPVIVLAQSKDPVFSKLQSNIENVISRQGRLFVFTDSKEYVNSDNLHVIPMPEMDNFTAPIAYVIPLQFLAYYTASAKGTDIDQPRNLAKSVTVE